jgi:nitrogen-specific signal transduction histidine kinase
VTDEHGTPVRVFGASQDITDIARAQQEIMTSQKLESVGTLASGIAHDFNNLLGSVLAQAELACAELQKGGSPARELEGIREVALRGAEIVRQLMIYAGQESAAVGLVDVSEIVSEMLELLRVSVAKNAALHLELARDLPPIRASAAQLRQLVMNLVTNASDAVGEQGGLIRVATRIAANTAPAAHGAPCMQLEVTDTGSGIPVETRSKLFDPFYTTKAAGRGLGLAVVQGIVRGLGGSIEVDSEVGRGSSFLITLPCAEGAAPAQGAAGGAVTLPNASADTTVLVVEDEHPLRNAIVKLLQKQGFEALAAPDGDAAADFLRTEGRRIDMVLLDMTIPGMSSQDVLSEIEKRRPGCKVLLTSAYSEELVRATLGGPQVRGFIRKPFRLADLMASIRGASAH